MEPTDWAPEHSGALQELLGLRLSFSEITTVINRRFNAAYSRSAVVGRARRMKLVGTDRPRLPPLVQPQLNRLGEVCPAWPVSPRIQWPRPPIKETKPVRLRCVEIDPRHLSLFELKPGDCRYPYGGDEEGEAITFCGHPRRPGSSYCTPHFHLTSGPGSLSERTACDLLLKMVETA